MKQKAIIFLFVLGFLVVSKMLKSQDIAPQVWSNFGVAWNINDHFSWRNSAAFNVLLSDEYPWHEFNLTSTVVYKFEKYFEVTLGVYTARTKQSLSLSSYEVRPFVGFRVSTNSKKRWLISNLSRFETRQIIYSDVDHSLSFRFRNRSDAAVSLNRPSMAMTKNNLFVFGYFEAFFNFGQEVRERFFNQFKYKLGLGYRLNDSWNFNLGFIYQDAKGNVILPSQLPTNLITNYVIEWGIVFLIASKKSN